MTNLRSLSRQTIQQLDRRTIEEFGVPGRVLMELAGKEVAAEVLRILKAERVSRAIRGSLELDAQGQAIEAPRTLEELEAWKAGLNRVDGPVAIFCGPGNNGGDGWVVARTLLNAGVQVVCVFPGEREDADVPGDAGDCFRAFERFGGAIAWATDEGELERARPALARCTVIVDALFGIGLTRQLAGVYLSAVRMINSLQSPVVAVDLPSGIDADNGEILGAAVRAAVTVTFAAAKHGLIRDPGNAFAGEIRVVEMGIPQHLVREALALEG